MLKPTLPLLLLILPSSLWAQTNDFGLDLSAGIEKKLLYNRLTLEMTGGFRSQDNTSRAERYSLELNASYKLLDHGAFGIKAELGYDHIWSQTLSECQPTYKDKPRHVVYEEDKFDYIGNGQFLPAVKGYTSGYNIGYNYTSAYWRQRSRINMAASFSYKPTKRWSFSLKETLQYNHFYSATASRTEYREKIRFKERYDDDGNPYTYTETTDTLTTFTKEKNSKNRWILRSKLTVQYNIRKNPFAPYLSIDYGVGLNYNAYKWKLTAGTDIKLSKAHSLKAFYRFQTENDDDEPNGHHIGLGYNFKF
ncbi:MAG: DUF2490 domain-containing protein [Bacteroidaceae bacterium]|nr:DUF2490 domain-containing protein [Bacteroidaceae bacterium]